MTNEINYTTTENGAVALRSTGNTLLDAFGRLGAMRTSSEEEIIHVFSKAFNYDPEKAMRLLFYMRDIRGGQGARRVFRVILQWLAVFHPTYVTHNFENIAFFGRYDDAWCLLDSNLKEPLCDWIYHTLSNDRQLKRENKPCSLLAKWLPSENTSSAQTRRYAAIIRQRVFLTPRNYRKLLTELRTYIKVVEQKMSANKWNEINYEDVPGTASIRYNRAFLSHDGERYSKYLVDAYRGKVNVNAKALFPVDIIHKIFNDFQPNKSLYPNHLLLQAMWENLPNYFEEKEETGICVVDTSGSMRGTPLEVAVSLGLYCADKCRGPFAGKFITFSNHPILQQINGESIVDKAYALSTADWEMNTDLEAVFNLILKTALRNHTPAKDMPQKLYIISDMQFDQARGVYTNSFQARCAHNDTFMYTMKTKYARAGYAMPSIVYWNVRDSKCGMFQDTFGGENCCMVSGYSPSLFKSVIDGTRYEEERVVDNSTHKVVTVKKAVVDPMSVMLAAIMNERYDRVWVGQAKN